MIFSLTSLQDHLIFFILTQESGRKTNMAIWQLKSRLKSQLKSHQSRCDVLPNLEAIKCFSENFKIEDFQNCEILQDKIKAEMIRYCLEQRLIELKNCSDEFDKEKRSLDATKVKGLDIGDGC